MTAFQPDAFQHNAFQVGFLTGGSPPAVVVLLRTLMGAGLAIALCVRMGWG